MMGSCLLWPAVRRQEAADAGRVGVRLRNTRSVTRLGRGVGQVGSLGSTSLLAADRAWRTEDRHETPSHAPDVPSQPSLRRGACRRRWRRAEPRQPARPRPRPGCHAERRPGRVPVGNPRRSGRPLGNPAHLAIAPDGSIWVADGDNDRFQIFAPDGSLLEAWGTTGSGEGEFDFTTIGWGGYDQAAIAFAPDGTLLRRRPRQPPHPEVRPGPGLPDRLGQRGDGARAVRHRQSTWSWTGRVGSTSSTPIATHSRRPGDRRRAGLRRRRAVPRRVGRARHRTGAVERTVRDRARPRRHAPGRRVRQQPRAALHAGGRAPRRVGRGMAPTTGSSSGPWTRRWTPRGACS